MTPPAHAATQRAEGVAAAITDMLHDDGYLSRVQRASVYADILAKLRGHAPPAARDEGAMGALDNLERLLIPDGLRAEWGVITLVNDEPKGYHVEDQNGGELGSGPTLAAAISAAAEGKA